jgi:hypothetical protein
MPDKDCLCGGSGTIYDYNPNGDPCPECDGGKFSTRGQINYQASVYKMKGGCVVVGLIALAAVTGLAEAIRLLLS